VLGCGRVRGVIRGTTEGRMEKGRTTTKRERTYIKPANVIADALWFEWVRSALELHVGKSGRKEKRQV
jgi:hypothetical protein